MEKHHAITLLTQRSPKALQFAHVFMGFDFKKPFSSTYIGGSFTPGMIKPKDAPANDYNILIFVCVQDRRGWEDPKLYAATMTEKETLRGLQFSDVRNFRPWNYSIDYFNGCGPFEEVRKHRTRCAYVIYQLKAYQTENKEHQADIRGRFAADFSIDRHYHGYLASFHALDVPRSIPYWLPKDYDRAQILDKSGFCLTYYRDALRNRKDALHASREKAAYLSTDYSVKIGIAENSIKSTRLLVSSLLSSSEDCEQVFSRLEIAASTLKEAASLFNELKEKHATNKYRSADEIEEDLNKISALTARVCGFFNYIRPSEIHAAAAAILPPEDIDHHDSDLYIKWSTAAKNLLARLSCKSLLTTFRDGHSSLWYELPFCYNPAVEGKQ